MTALPKKKHSRGRKRRKLAHAALAMPTISLCNCGRARFPHRACPSCGEYRGRVVPGAVRVRRERSTETE